MLLRSTILVLLALLMCGIFLRAEVEFTIHAGYGDTSKVQFPVLISLRDTNGDPVKGAVVALKRLGPDGWSEEEIVREAESRTDKNGMIVVMYPGTARVTSPGHSYVEIYGAVTIVAKGHRTVTIELRDHFKEGRYELTKDTVPHLEFALPGESATTERDKMSADRAADGKTPETPKIPR